MTTTTDPTAAGPSDGIVDSRLDPIDGMLTVPDAFGDDVIARARSAAREVDLVVDDAHASIPGWDNLAFVSAFARAAERAREVLRTSTHAVERRLVAARLLRLVPPALLPVGQRDRAVALSLPDAVLARADDDFALRAADDVHHLHPSWLAFLSRPGLVDDVLRPGRHEWLLAPRSLSPLHAVGSNVLVRVVDDVASDKALLAVEILAPDGSVSRRRLTSDGRDAGPAEVRADVLVSWLRHGGTTSRGLDLRRPEDRCLLLTFRETLRERRLDVLLARAAGDDADRRAAVVAAVVDAAADAVAFSALDPLACRFVFPVGDAHPWVDKAVGMLTSLGLAAEVTPRVVGDPTREIVWLDAVVDSGFIGGAMSAVAQARAFARLAVSVLAPLGALALVGARGGDGVVVTLLDEDARGARQRGPLWVSPAASTPVVPLAEAWARGAGRLLPTPTADTAHELAALPAWWQGFADAVAATGLPAVVESAPPSPIDTGSDEPLELVDDDDISALTSGEAEPLDVADVADVANVVPTASTVRPTKTTDVDDGSTP